MQEGIAPVEVVVVGGGTAGWMTAAALVGLLPRLASVTLIESQEIGIVGVGEATLPDLPAFLRSLGIDEREFMTDTSATYKLGIAFEGFGASGERYVHPFGSFGRSLGGVSFHHYWLRRRRDGDRSPIEGYSLAIRAALLGRFQHPAEQDGSLAASYGYAYQFDATRFAPILRANAEGRGVRRIEGKVTEVLRDADTGSITSVKLASGERVGGDLFVDCSGFRSLLLGQALDEEWEDWSRWLPCDRAVALPCVPQSPEIEPYTRAIAMPAGWRWRIPLQHRIGNGYVYSSQHLQDEAACEAILANVEGQALAEPRILSFRAGRRKRSWVGNVVAIGLASGFLEPLESTSIYLAQTAIARLVELFPVNGIAQSDRDEFNRLVDMEYDRIRDFLILHYHATRRTDSDFWNDVRTMAIPESLAENLQLWSRSGRVTQFGEGLFREPSWVAVCLGQGLIPTGFDPRAEGPDSDDLSRALTRLRFEIDAMARSMPAHRIALQQNGSGRATA